MSFSSRNQIMSLYVLNNCLASFNTMVDIKLKQWAEEQLPKKSIDIGWVVLKNMFKTMFKENQKVQATDEILDSLKVAVIDEALARHSWEDKVKLYFLCVFCHC